MLAGWYDSKLKAAKGDELVEPRIDQNEGAFDYALAATSRQAVTENFKYALDVFRTYMDTGVMPETSSKAVREQTQCVMLSSSICMAEPGQNEPLMSS